MPQPKAPALTDKPTVFVLSGPNLNLLGTREPEIYGHDTLNDIHARLEAQAAELGLRLECRQTNHEGVLIDWLHEAYVAGAKAVLLNAGGYTHTSIALHDAIKSIKVPVIEVHLSDPMQRESVPPHQLCRHGRGPAFCRPWREQLYAGAGRRRASLTRGRIKNGV